LKSFACIRDDSGPRIFVALLCVLLTAGSVQARVHRSQSWAETQFDKAESQHETLEARAEQSRTRRDYETVIVSYRRVVLEAPTSSKADDSAFEVAEITAEMGRRFKDDNLLNSALREYKFLRREYPGSKHRIAALLAIGKIYKNDLGDDSDGRDALQELLGRYPHSQYAEQARAELDSGEPGSAKNLAKNLEGEKANAKSNSATEKAQSSRDTAAPAESSVNDDDGGDKVVRLNGVRYRSSSDYTRVTVDLDQNVQFESQRIDNPDRIFFDLKNTRLSSELIGKSFDVDDGLVKKVRVAQYRPGRTRIVIETADRAAYNASMVLSPPRLIIDVHSGDAHSGQPDLSPKTLEATAANPVSDTSALGKVIPVGAKAPVPANVSLPKKVVVEADDDDAVDNPAAISSKAGAKSSKSASAGSPTKSRLTSARSMREAQPTSNGDRSLIRALGLKIGKIVIDPGHGGHDTGTIGPNGLLEKDLVLDVSKRLGKLLEARLGAEVVFTRRDDTFIPLETRTSIANQEQADLFVSVHANSSHDPDARGVETYYLNFTSSPEALEVAARENAASDQDIHQLQDLVKKIALKEKIEESREFASDVQQSLHSGLAARTSGIRDRGVKKAPFVVLIGANMPSILAEISFISNPGDEKRLKSAEYRQRIAESLYRGISRYVNGLGGVKVASRVEKASAD
jgi:N-acetylmuramoyl-L-alanine amidase